MDPQQQRPDDQDDFLDSLRRAAARTASDPSPSSPAWPAPARIDADAAAPTPPLVFSRTADALRDLEGRVGGLEEQLRRLNEDRDRVVADVADAVVARLDARWARSLSQDVDDTAG